MLKYVVNAKSETVETTHKVNDLDLALLLFIQAYESDLFDTVDLLDATTGEVLSHFQADPAGLWHSDAVTAHMMEAIADSGHLEDFISDLFS